MAGKKKDWKSIVEGGGFIFISSSQYKIKFKDESGFIFECYKNSYPPLRANLMKLCETPKEFFLEELKKKGLSNIQVKVESFDPNRKLRFYCSLHNYVTERTPVQALSKTHICKLCWKDSYETYDLFKTRLCDIFGEKYKCYEETYVDSQVPAKFSCESHGDFWKSPTLMLHSKVCSKCNKEEDNKNRQGRFIEKAKEIHGETYDYSNVVYEHSLKLVSIECREHGLFKQSCSRHLRGFGCPTCGLLRGWAKKRTSFSEFEEVSNKVHDNKYTYLADTYVSLSVNMGIICPEHGMFSQTPSSHKKGSGCPICAKINLTGRGWTRSMFEEMCGEILPSFYCLEISTENETFIKVGITSKTLKERISYMLRKLKKSGAEIEAIYNITAAPGLIFDLENHILRVFKEQRFVPSIRFGGWTECFNLGCASEILKEVEIFIREGGNKE